MYTASLPLIGTAAAWRQAAGRALSNRIEPDAITWLWACPEPPPPDEDLPARTSRTIRIPKDVLELTDSVIWHGDPARFDLAYRLLWQVGTNPKAGPRAATDLGPLRKMQGEVRRCQDRLRRAIRFHRLSGPGTVFGAWYDPAHPILEPTAPAFARRLEDLTWLIVTPALSVHGRDGALTFHAGPALPEWAPGTALDLEARAARKPAPSSALDLSPPRDLFAAPLPVQRRPRPARLHEPGLGGSAPSD